MNKNNIPDALKNEITNILKDITEHDAELVINNNMFNVSIPLSPMQVAVIIKILGIKFHDDEHIRCHSDDSLIKICGMNSNPLHFKEISNDE